LRDLSPALTAVSLITYDNDEDETKYRGARIRTGDLADPNGARYQAAPRPDASPVSHTVLILLYLLAPVIARITQKRR
jgi:hypothetical protein